MKRTAVLNVVGLSQRHIGKHTPAIAKFQSLGQTALIDPAFPAVTCTAQSNYLTGKRPSDHGIVANGWYNHELAEVTFWKQPNQTVQSPKLWEDLRLANKDFTCATMFWWFNMYSDVEWSATPRPMYPADGSKHFDIYTWPYELRPSLKAKLGDFPFPAFWGPMAGQQSPAGKPEAVSEWIANAAKQIEQQHQPSLNLVYLPHLDYNLQRLGPEDPKIANDLQRIDRIVGELIGFFTDHNVQIVLLSEYGITPVEQPVHLNRLFRERGWLAIKEELGLERLDCGNSQAFAVADHQVAHVYINDKSIENNVRSLLEGANGVAAVWGQAEKQVNGIDHPRAGDLIVTSAENAWFTYYYWLDDAMAPDFARCVDIHRKPGYDPVELFKDPARGSTPRVMHKLLKKKLGFRMLMDVIPLDAQLVKGSHGCRPCDPVDWPILISNSADIHSNTPLKSIEVYGVLRSHILGS
ncbi:MAG TPA: alkaline phosphatase family protein [Verrucomicrobiota bacterium]|nr:alkaline phosphatase family protein [Verrucomicrobiota bacterium]